MMQDFSSMAQQMQNIAGGRPAMPQPRQALPSGPQPNNVAAVPPQGAPAGGEQLMQLIMQIAQQIELATGMPASPEQIQAALSQVMPGVGGAAPPPGAAPADAMPQMQGGQPMIPPQIGMRR